MSDTIKNEPAKPSGSDARLVRDLTGITPRKRDKILRMIEQLEDELDDNDLVMFCGGTKDYALLLHRETGIQLGFVGNYGVFMGGDLPIAQLPNGIQFSRHLSSTSGCFANAKSHPTATETNTNTSQ